MEKINLFFLTVAIGALQGFILSIAIISIKKRNKNANKFLSLFLFLISVTMIGRLITETSIFKSYPNFLALPDAIIFLYGPLMYIYLRKLLLLSPMKKSKFFILFIPALLFVLSEIPLLLDENNSLRVLWTKETTLRFIFIEGLAIVHNIYFYIKQINLFLKYKKASNNNFSYRQYPSHFKILYILVGTTIIVWLLSYFSWVFGYYNVFSHIGYRVIWLILPFITYIMGYFAMKEPDLFRMSTSNYIPSKKKIPTTEKEELITKVKQLMIERKLYKRPDFSLTFLSDTLGVDRNKLSFLINQEFKKNFNDWTNDYRIKSAKNLLLESDLSIKEIYYEVGFNSKSAFNRAFKTKVNQTPSDYRLKSLSK